MAAGFIRLKQRSDFLRVAASGRKQVRPGVVLQVEYTPTDIRPEPDSKEIRVGFTVTRKIGKAVVRNKARRRLRAAADDTLRDYGKPGFDYVLIGRRTTLTHPYKKLVLELRSALAHLHDDQGRQMIRD